VIDRDGKDKTDQVLPLTTFVSENPEDLWKWMSDYEKTTGGKLLATRATGTSRTAACSSCTPSGAIR
jgi:hypothetical protein